MRHMHLVLASLAFVWSAASGSELIEGRVVGVADGDTITVLTTAREQVKVRLEGIDAPEKAQPYGQASKQSLSQLVFRRQVRLECDKTDRFRRKVCRVFRGEMDVNREQIARGMAWHFDRYADEQPEDERRADEQAEMSARGRGTGLFADPRAVAPWDWRAARKP
jgi:endonuclease YncB( thermonuclease family)